MVWCGLFVVALLVSSSARSGGRVAALFSKLGHAVTGKSSGLVSKATGVLAVGFIVCAGLSCDTNAVIKITETVHTERDVQVNYSYQQMYFVIDGIAWPYHAVAVPDYGVPDYGYPEVIDRECDYVPMEVMYGNTVPDHEYVGAEVAYLSPPYEGEDPYYHYGTVKDYYGNGFYEVEVSSWSASYSYRERTTLTRTYTVLIDATLSADNGGIILEAVELE